MTVSQRDRRSARREQIIRWWNSYQWPVLAALWAIALYLGYRGFGLNAAARHEERSPLDLFYLTLQLIPMNSGAVAPPVSWQLQLGRFMIPALTAYTAARTLMLLFRDQLQVVRLRFVRDHVVICGLSRKGFLLARNFTARRDPVVVIERDGENDWVEECRALGAIVLLGNAADRAVQARAGVARARCLIAVCDDDATNAEITATAREIASGRQGEPLTCVIHVVDSRFYHLLREHELGSSAPSGIRLEFFNVFERGARLMLAEAKSPLNGDGQPQVLVVGIGRFGESVVVHLGRTWWERRARPDHKLLITVVDREAAAKVEALHLRYPRLSEACEFQCYSMDLRSVEFDRAAFLYDETGACKLAAAYVCLDSDSLGLRTGLALRQRVRCEELPIVVRMSEATGLARLLQDIRNDRPSAAGLHIFGLLDHTCTPDLLLGGTHEVLARAIHEEYVRQAETSGSVSQDRVSLAPWDSLPDSLKASNRRQADHIGVKLQAVGCVLAPLADWDAASFRFDENEETLLARLEHERWCEEKGRDGWTYKAGAPDYELKTHPDLVPWNELPRLEQEKNRNTVRKLPEFLTRAGFQVERSAFAVYNTIPQGHNVHTTGEHSEGFGA